MNWIHEHLLPGGVVVLGNCDVTNPDRAFMDHILEWPLIHRSPAQLRALVGRSSFAQADVAIAAPAEGVQLFASCTKM